MAGNRALDEIVFLDNQTTITDGETHMITSDASVINIDFFGSGTFEAVIEGKVSHRSNNFDEIMAVNLKTYNMVSKPNTFDTWQISTVGWTYIRVKLTSVNGAVTAVGKVVG